MATLNYFSAYNETLSTHVNPGLTWQEPTNTCKIAGASLSANTKYLVMARGAVGGSSNAKLFGLRVSTDDDANVAADSEVYYEAPVGSSIQGKWLNYVGSYTTDSSPADIKLEIRGPTDATLYCRELSLVLLDLDDLGSDNYIETVNRSSAALTTSMAAQVTISTLADSTEYLFLGSLQVLCDNATTSVQAELRDGSTAKQYWEMEGEDVNEILLLGFQGAWTTAATANDVTIHALSETTTGNYDHEYSYLIAIDTSAFEEFNYDYNATGATSDTSAATWDATNAAIASYTPSTFGPHLVSGTCSHNSATLNQIIAFRVGWTGGQYLTPSAEDMDWRTEDPTDHLPGFHFGVDDWTSGARAFTLDANLGASAQHVFADELLWVLNLEKTGVASNDLTAAISGTATVTAELETIQNLSAAPTGTATITAALRAVNGLTAALSGTATVAVTLSNTGTNPLTAALSGTATLAIREIAAGPYRGLNTASDALAGTVDVTEALATTVGVTDG